MSSYGGQSGVKVPRPRGKKYDIRKNSAPGDTTWVIYKNNARWKTAQTKNEAEGMIYRDKQETSGR